MELKWLESQTLLRSLRTRKVLSFSSLRFSTLLFASSFLFFSIFLLPFFYLTWFVAAYRRDLRREEYGDERIPEMRKFLLSISPSTNAHKYVNPNTSPLLLYSFLFFLFKYNLCFFLISNISDLRDRCMCRKA